MEPDEALSFYVATFTQRIRYAAGRCAFLPMFSWLNSPSSGSALLASSPSGVYFITEEAAMEYAMAWAVSWVDDQRSAQSLSMFLMVSIWAT